MKDPVGFGLIGCGVWGEVHARTYAVSPHADFIAVCDRDQERAKKFAGQFNAVSYYTDIEKFLDNSDIKAVSIVTPDFTHTDLICAAMAVGKHVIVEKPLATTVDDCKKILAARDANGVKLMVNYSNRWKTPFIHVKRMVEFGELGELLMMNLRLNDTLYVPTKMLSWAAKSNPLHFLGTHLIDLVRYISQSEVNRVYSVSRSVVLNKMGIDTPDFFQSVLELSGGATAYLENCWIIAENAPSVWEFKAEFVGSKGTVFVDLSHHRMIEKYTGLGAGMPDVGEPYDLKGNPLGHASIEHFIDCVIHDTAPLVSGEDGLAAVKIVAALEKSSQIRGPIDI